VGRFGSPQVIFDDRGDAGRRLAALLADLGDEPLVVLGLPRGGVIVAAEVARVLGAPLDVIVVRKLGVPDQPELAMGAIGEDGVAVYDDEIIRAAHVSLPQLERVEARERDELLRRVQLIRDRHPRISLAGRTAVIVDDGIATGATARAACQVARAHGADRVVLAVPVAPADWQQVLGDAADRLVAVATPEPFVAVGCHYSDFRQVTDDEVLAALEAARPAEEA
jgi:putative phosphoribosyl transferase